MFLHIMIDFDEYFILTIIRQFVKANLRQPNESKIEFLPDKGLFGSTIFFGSSDGQTNFADR